MITVHSFYEKPDIFVVGDYPKIQDDEQKRGKSDAVFAEINSLFNQPFQKPTSTSIREQFIALYK